MIRKLYLIKESALPDWQDTLMEEVYNVLKQNGIYAEVYDGRIGDIKPTANSFVLCVEIEWGDWKHEHRAADYVINNLLDNYDNLEVTNLGETVTDEDGSDTYSAIHKYHIIRAEDIGDYDNDEQLDIKFSESVDLNDYKFKFYKGDYKIYFKLDKGTNKGLWVAQKEGEEPFEISYEQARGFEPINPTDRIVQNKLKKALKK